MKKLLLAGAVSAALVLAPVAASHAHDRMAGSNHVSSMGKKLKLTKKHLAEQDVRKLQNALHKKGFYPEPADGVWGPKTTRAIQKYQKKNKLRVNGVLDQKTLSHLGVEISAVSKASR